MSLESAQYFVSAHVNFSLDNTNICYIIGCIPLDPRLTSCLEEGKNFLELYQDSPTLKALDVVVQRLITIDRDLP